MGDDHLSSIFSKVRDQHSAAMRWSYLGVLLLLLFHLINISPYVSLKQKMLQTERQKDRLSEVKSKIETIDKGFKQLKDHELGQFVSRLKSFVSDFRSAFKGLDLIVRQLQEEGRFEREIRARDKSGERLDFRELRESDRSDRVSRRGTPRDTRDEMVQRTRPSRRIEEIPVIQITDQELIDKIKQIEDYMELLNLLKPFIEKNIIEPGYLDLNEYWKTRILPEIQSQFDSLEKEIEAIKKLFPEGTVILRELKESLEGTLLAFSNMEIKTPAHDPFWWSTVEEKERVRIGIEDRVADRLNEPPALLALRVKVNTLLRNQEKFAGEIQKKISALEQQIKDQQEMLTSLAKPLKFIALELNSVMKLFPLLIGLIISALTIWTVMRLRELGQITHLMVKQGASPLLWDWYFSQGFLLRPRPMMDKSGPGSYSSIIKPIGLCMILWAWIGIAAWQTYGVGDIESKHLILVTCISAAVVALSHVYSHVSLNSALSLKNS